MKPIVVKEQKRFEKVSLIAKDLNTKDLSSKVKMEAFNGLIQRLNDVAFKVRDKAYATLIKIADKQVAGYDPKTPDKKAVENWKNWLIKEKAKIEKQIKEKQLYVEKLVKDNPKFVDITQLVDIEVIIAALDGIVTKIIF